tara:strand:+ start:5424 stop:6317 length:894 start_codon:yes stop_codon:yes gene_type:complete
MYVFGEIKNESSFVSNRTLNSVQSLSASSDGINSIKIVSGSINQNYWNSLNVLFYTSGSPRYSNETKFTHPTNNFSLQLRKGNQFVTKYHGYPSSSLISISQRYFGEKIKEGSFQFTDVSDSNVDNNNINPIIIDDGKGNLYSTNAHHSQSNTNASSSDNYVGNIFYDKGLVVLTETGSWSGSVNYSDLATNYNLKFQSVHTINTYEYNVNINPDEFNHSSNYTLRKTLSGSNPSHTTLATSYLSTDYTGSDFHPYITTINLYQKDNYDMPVIQATLPRPIRKSDKINLRFKIQLDI